MKEGRKQNTYRLTREVDKWVEAKAQKLGISKNAVVQMTLARAIQEEQEEKAG